MSIKSIIFKASTAFFILCLVFPSRLISVKFMLILVITVIVLFRLSLTKKIYIAVNRKEVSRFYLYCAIAIGLYSTLLIGWFHGAYVENIGVYENIPLYFIYPLFWVVYFLIIGRARIEELIKSTVVNTCIFLSIITLIEFLLAGTNLYGYFVPLGNLLSIQSGDNDGTFYKQSAPFQPTLVFGFACLIELLVEKIRYKIKNQNKTLLEYSPKIYISLFLVLAALLVSGRSMAFICLLWGYLRLFPLYRSNPRYGFSILIISLICFLFFLNEVHIQNLLYKLDSDTDIGARRINQLLEGYALATESPFFGKGVGYAFSSAGGDWRIEVTPIVILVSHGVLVCFALIATFTMVSFRLLKKEGLSVFVFPPLLYIVISATNPILLQFDFLWVVVLPWVMLLLSFCSDRPSRGNKCFYY
jgi:hypothetical protein